MTTGRRGGGEVIPMRTRPIGLGGRLCECGALAEDGSATCGKCRNRARWQRRRSWRGAW